MFLAVLIQLNQVRTESARNSAFIIYNSSFIVLYIITICQHNKFHLTNATRGAIIWLIIKAMTGTRQFAAAFKRVLGW